MPSGDILTYILLISAAYLLGSVPTGIVVVRLFGGVDPRQSGSRNIGATNVSRTSGKLPGILTLAGDLFKGALPVFIAFRLGPAPLVSLTGLAAFLGHLFPVYLGFKGGKGVATACGVMLIISPIATLLSAGVFVVTVAIKRYVSLGSILAAASLPVFLSFLTKGKPFVSLGVAISALVIIKHRENIKRLAEGRENKIGGKKD
ncbi:MAG TPA: acyl-phosphate glycerol 3-phosphate acyltransferase [Deltaproteobacteria bacterium]|nr:acyl-phosphate glycerol 3-phosphate acyltransferase [Deltaproteobacteria bacterium]